MSVYNGEAYLAEAIESILGQTFADFEFIIVDDGSSDRTGEILARHAARDSRIRVLRQRNQGIAVALNLGIAEARAPYIARMDADDVALPARFQAQLDHLAAHPEIDVLGTAAELMTASSQPLHIHRPPSDACLVAEEMERHNVFLHPTVVMKKTAVDAVGGYRALLVDAEDYDLFLRLGEHGALANLPEPLLRLRIHDQQVTLRHLEHQQICVLAARASARCRRSGRPDPLRGLTEIRLEMLGGLGLDAREIAEPIGEGYCAAVQRLKSTDPDRALELVGKLRHLRPRRAVPRDLRAGASLAVAGIYRRRRRLPRAALAFACALCLHPALACRSLRNGSWRRLPAALA